MKLKPAPATFGVESISDFLVSKNRDFRPTDILEDADGSLLVIDTGGWFHNGCPQSKVAKADVLGAIYRIRRASTAKVKDPRGMELDWKTLAPRDFSQRMADPRPAVRERAIAVLAAELRQQTKVEEAAPFVREFSQSQPDVRQRWIDALGRANTRSTLSLVADALADPEPRLRQTASRVLLFADANRLPNADVLFEKLIEEVRAGPPDNRRAALATLGQMFSRRTHFVASLLAATPDCEQERLQFHALAYALIASGDRHALAEELQRGNPFRQKAAAAALEALRAMRSGNTPATWIEFPAPFQSKPLREEERRAFLAIEGNLPSGDKTRGQALFNSDQASCAKCHRVGSTGGEVGPDLSTIGRSRSSRDLLEALLFPSSNFSRGFAPYSVITKDGASFTGIVLGEKPDQVRIGIDATHANWISASNIESIKPAETSIMPQDIVQRLKPEQLADLLAYLNSLQ